jgi:predicted acetyltransferase
MLRIADVAGALTQRAYAPGLAASLHLHVTDDALPSNAGPIVLSIADGAGHVERGGDARIRLGVRALASIYTGFHRPESLAALGLVEGPEDDLRRLGAAFAGAAPAMSDMF